MSLKSGAHPDVLTGCPTNVRNTPRKQAVPSGSAHVGTTRALQPLSIINTEPRNHTGAPGGDARRYHGYPRCRACRRVVAESRAPAFDRSRRGTRSRPERV